MSKKKPTQQIADHFRDHNSRSSYPSLFDGLSQLIQSGAVSVAQLSQVAGVSPYEMQAWLDCQNAFTETQFDAICDHLDPMGNRRCTVCCDLNQDVPACIYAKTNRACPACGNVEFSITLLPITPINSHSSQKEPMTTKAAPTKKAPAKGKKNAPSPTATAAAKDTPPVTIVSIPPTGPIYAVCLLSLLFPDPKNPRDIDPNDPDIQETAATMRDVGILEPLLVRPMEDGPGWMVMAGHRRRVAALVAGLTQAPCLIYPDANEATATEIRIIENLARVDLNAIELAQELQQGMADLGLNQNEIAKKFQRSPAWVSHHVRLLKLPTNLQGEIVEGRLTKTQGRVLATLADLPAVIDEFTQAYHNCEWGEDQESIDAQYFEDCLMCGLDTGMRRMNSRGVGVSFTPTDEQRKLLDIREITFSDGVEEWAANVTLFDELQAAAVEARKPVAKNATTLPTAKPAGPDDEEEGDETSDSTDDSDLDLDTPPATASTSKPGKKPQPAPAVVPVSAETQQANQKAAGEKFNKEMYTYYINWLRSKLIERVGEMHDEDVMAWVMGMAISSTGSPYERFRCLESALEIQTKKKRPSVPSEKSWQWVSEIRADVLYATGRCWIKQWLKLPVKSTGTDATPVAIQCLADIMEFDLSTWKVDREFLMLHTIDQLRLLETEWELTSVFTGTSKTAFVDYLLKAGADADAPVWLRCAVPCPL